MAFEARAAVTDEAKRRIGEMWVSGKSYMVKYFSVTAGGHDPADPDTALAIDTSSTTMPGAPPIFGPELIDSYEWESDTCPTFVCTIEQGELLGAMSSVGLYAEIVYSPIPGDPEVGTTFLYAVYNRPRLTITSTDGPVTFNLTPYM
jgi:hypothetical protein